MQRNLYKLPHAETCERNKVPILEVLNEAFRSIRTVLEIGSGTGQHAVYFAAHLPHLRWQPSDRRGAVDWITRRVRQAGLSNINPPLAIDVTDHPWDFTADGVFSANTLHIMSWPEVEHFFEGVGQALNRPGTLGVYGPFRYAGCYTSESNARFDQSLQRQAAHMGIRDFEAVNELAVKQGLSLATDNAMPANNQLLVWRTE